MLHNSKDGRATAREIEAATSQFRIHFHTTRGMSAMTVSRMGGHHMLTLNSKPYRFANLGTGPNPIFMSAVSASYSTAELS